MIIKGIKRFTVGYLFTPIAFILSFPKRIMMLFNPDVNRHPQTKILWVDLLLLPIRVLCLPVTIYRRCARPSIPPPSPTEIEWMEKKILGKYKFTKEYLRAASFNDFLLGLTSTFFIFINPSLLGYLILLSGGHAMAGILYTTKDEIYNNVLDEIFGPLQKCCCIRRPRRILEQSIYENGLEVGVPEMIEQYLENQRPNYRRLNSEIQTGVTQLSDIKKILDELIILSTDASNIVLEYSSVLYSKSHKKNQKSISSEKLTLSENASDDIPLLGVFGDRKSDVDELQKILIQIN